MSNSYKQFISRAVDWMCIMEAVAATQGLVADDHLREQAQSLQHLALKSAVRLLEDASAESGCGCEQAARGALAAYRDRIAQQGAHPACKVIYPQFPSRQHPDGVAP